ncbi:TetR/AcrR family transcriptional regulator [Streptococcus loxodontisalivarius]|uniref:TetR/AcrR family transcriptional repressor of nem operon n=1 Tax=Streptococcus loxodontisalivarius TaxID=1349415 RepID=A0ABS2PRR3_9STRE|nr:TetR/AcrR family transcriptional regulator [Streptococcus loxodontisalivarius]MBM7642733.1 TetR/AcrR family transcriptional repressor of nem operon [Streptococcus loxodontisalivarius]
MSVREDIIDQTQDLMYRQGYVATSISDIMKAANVGKGQLYHYFTSKKQIGIEVTQSLIEKWDRELFQGIFATDQSAEDKFLAMLDWVYEFHENQEGEIYYGCPMGNLIVELSAQEKDFRVLLKDFIDQWLAGTAKVLQGIHPDWSEKKSLQEASNIIATIQGSILILKVSQDLSVLTKTVNDLKEKYL